MTALALALLVPWLAGVLLVLFDGRRPLVGWVSVTVLAATVGVLLVLAAQVLPDGVRQIRTGSWPPGVGIVLRADPLGVTFAVLSAAVLLVAAVAETLSGVRERTFPGLVVLLATGLNGLFLTGDVFNFYVFFELAMTASYVLATYGGHGRQLRAALVFAAVNLLGSFVFLLSVAGTYRVTGTLAMSTVAERIGPVDPNAALLVAVGFFLAFSVKLGLFPFHFWLPTVYSGTRPAVAAILSGAVVNIGAYGLLRFGADLFANELRLGATVLVVLGALSILYGAVLAVAAGDTTEMLAYSAIGQAGYVLVAVGVGGPIGLAAAVLYSIVNAANKTLLFLSAGLRGAFVAGAVAIGALSVAGVPPAAGFVGKLALFRTGADANSPALLVLLVVGSALSLLYLFQVYQREFWRGDRRGTPSPRRLRVLVLVLGIGVLAAGIWPEPLLSVSQQAADAVLAGRAR